jgi:hypothetical protein
MLPESLQQQVAEPGISFTGLSCTGASEANAITSLNNFVYVAGFSKFEDGQVHPVLSKYSADLVRQWKARLTDVQNGNFLGVTAFGGAIYAVGYAGAAHTNFLIEKCDENGARLWSHTSGGALDDCSVLGGGYLGNYHTQTVTVRNNSSQSIAGPVDLIMDGVPRSCSLPGRAQPSTCGPYPANLTHCASTNGSAWVTVTSGSLAPNAAASVTVTMYPGQAVASSFNFTARVFSGNPNQ